MPYPTGHCAAVHKRIVDSARKLFNRRGLSGRVSDKLSRSEAAASEFAF